MVKPLFVLFQRLVSFFKGNQPLLILTGSSFIVKLIAIKEIFNGYVPHPTAALIRTT